MNRIICAAIHIDDSQKHISQPKNIESGFVICGLRHFNCFHLCTAVNVDIRKFNQQGKVIQGFLTSDNLFVDRKVAAQIALEAKQISEEDKIDVLFSEDLY